MPDVNTSTYTQIGNREDLSDIVTNISPEATPFFSGIGEGKELENTYFQWLTDEDNAPADNAAVQGADAVATASSTRANCVNYAQAQEKVKKVTDEQEKTKKPSDIGSEEDYQTIKATREILKDAEYAFLVNTTGTAGIADVSAAKTKGLAGWITTNTATAQSAKWSAAAGTDGNGEEEFNKLLQQIWDCGGNPDIVFMDGTRKRATARWTAGQDNNRNASDKRIVNGLTYYETDFGIVKLQAHWVMGQVAALKGKVFIVDRARFKKRFQTKTYKKPLPNNGRYSKFMVTHTLGLVSYQEKASGMITLS